MNVVDIKTELQQMIEQEKNMSVLEAIHTILQKTRLNPMVKEKLVARALQSEKDIAEGNLFSKEAVVRRAHRK